MPKKWVSLGDIAGSGYWQDFNPVTKDQRISDFYKNAVTSLTPDAGTTPVINSYGPGTQPVIQFVSGGKQYSLAPAIGGSFDESGAFRDDQGLVTNMQGYQIDPSFFGNWSNNSHWTSKVEGLPVMKADWAADLVNNSIYKSSGLEYTGGGWLSESPIKTNYFESAPDNESWLSSFMQGPAIPLGAWLGAGAFGSGGLGNFLGSFGNSTSGLIGGAVGGGGGGGGVIGGGMFDPFADFGGSYFDGFSNYLGGAGDVIPSSYGASGYPSSGVYSNGPTFTNPFNSSTITWDGGASGTTTIPGLLGNTNGTGLLNNLLGGGQGFSGLGAGLGALLGMLGANQKPAGTVTSVQDIPDYLKPYQSMNLASGTANFANAGAGGALLPGAAAQLGKTINGDYLDPNTNPALQPYVKDLMGQAGANFASLYGKSPDNLNNSAFQENYTRAITNAALPLYNQAFQTERGNQINAANAAPGFASNYAGAALAPNLAFKNLYTGPQATTQPYFTNPMGGALSGALAGGMLGNSVFGSR